MSAGIGYSMPKIVARVINAVLGLFGTKPIPPCIDRAGTILEFPSRQLFHGNT
jgi:hypothetical protein